MSDVLYAATHSEIKYATFANNDDGAKAVKYVEDFRSVYYLRCAVGDEVGVLGKMCTILGKHGVSIAEVGQKAHEVGNTERVPVYIITHKTNEKQVQAAIAEMNSTDFAEITKVIRIEE